MAHWSDCAVHNEPAYPAGPCNCGGNAPQSPENASLGHETLVQHAQATVAADGAEDEAEVERVARAIEHAFVEETGGFSEADNRKIGLLCARAAIGALRGVGDA